MIRMNVHIAQ